MKRKEEITKMLNAMNEYQEAAEPMLHPSLISMCNDLYDEVSILFFGNSPDGEYQEKLRDKLDSGDIKPMTFTEAMLAIADVMERISQSVQNEIEGMEFSESLN